MPMTTVVEKPPVPPTFTAYRCNGTQADIDAFNVYLNGSGWTATFIDANTWRIDGPYGTRRFGLPEVMVFQKDADGVVRAVAKFPNLAAAQKRFT